MQLHCREHNENNDSSNNNNNIINIIIITIIISYVAPTLQGLRKRSDFSVYAAALQGKGLRKRSDRLVALYTRH